MHDHSAELADLSPRVAVIVPARNVEHHVIAQLDALAPQLRATGAELVVVDDASEDGTAAAVCRWAQDTPLAVTVLTTPHRRGANASRNAGLRATAAPIVCFTDGDDIVEPGWLQSMVAAADSHPLVGGGFRMLAATDDVPVVSDAFDLVGVPYPLGSCMAMQRWIIDRVGGFDENVWRGGTEADFFVRVALATGLSYHYAQGATVRYRVDDGWRNEWKRSTTRARGQGYLTNVYRREPDCPAGVAHSLGSSLRQWSEATLHLATGPDRGHQAAVAAGALVRAFWLLRYRFVRPERHLADPEDAALYEVIHPRATAEHDTTPVIAAQTVLPGDAASVS